MNDVQTVFVLTVILVLTSIGVAAVLLLFGGDLQQ